MKKCGVLFLSFLLLSVSNAVYALDFGSISETVTTILGSISELLNVIAWVSGAGFAISAVIKYREHRARPQSVPLSGPLIEGLLAIVLISFPFFMEMTAKKQPGVDKLSQVYRSVERA